MKNISLSWEHVALMKARIKFFEKGAGKTFL